MRNKLIRSLGSKRYNKVYFIVTEGAKTERAYFEWLRGKVDSAIHVKVLKKKHSQNSPRALLGLIRAEIRNTNFATTDDEAWIVLDKDKWTDEQLDMAYAWSVDNYRHGLALSNPKFEYWLLLHFEDARGISTSKECTEQLKRYLPEYQKAVDMNRFTSDVVRQAVLRARQKDCPRCEKWPVISGSTVYRLVERILNEP